MTRGAAGDVSQQGRPGLTTMGDTDVGQIVHPHRPRGLAGTGCVATLAAMAATTLAAALARAVGVEFEVPDGGEAIPLSGFTVMTGLFSVVGVVLAAALRRWSARPAERFVRTAVALTAISLVRALPRRGRRLHRRRPRRAAPCRRDGGDSLPRAEPGLTSRHCITA